MKTVSVAIGKIRTLMWLFAVSIAALSRKPILRRQKHKDFHDEVEYGSTSDFPIVVTTFSKRLMSNCAPLLAQLRAAGIINPIYVVINGDFKSSLDFDSRAEFLSECTRYPKIQPICFGTFRGLSTLWNTGVRMAGGQTTLILNDDLLVMSRTIIEDVKELFRLSIQKGLVVYNNHWSVFAISRECINRVGWFDENLIGIGEEDGDYELRYLQEYSILPPQIVGGSFFNVSDSSRDDKVSPGKGKFSLWNKVYFQVKYERSSFGLKGSLQQHNCIPKFDTPNPYPLENFVELNHRYLSETNEETIEAIIHRQVESLS